MKIINYNAINIEKRHQEIYAGTNHCKFERNYFHR